MSDKPKDKNPHFGMVCPTCGYVLKTKTNKKGDLGIYCHNVKCDEDTWWITV